MKIRHTLALFSISTVFILGSCGKTACKPVEIEENLTAHADISQDDVTYEADFERAGGAGWKVTFTSPETVDGMEVNLFNDSCTVNFKGLSYSGERKELPQYGMVSLITSAIDQCIEGKVKCEAEGDITTEKGTAEDLDFSAEFKSKKLSSVSIPDVLEVKFG